MTKRVLIVDDEPDIRLAIRILLNKHGYEVEEAENGESALQKLLPSQFDLMILDLMMPIMDGFRVIKDLRKRGIYLPVIVLTAKEGFHSRCLTRRIGAAMYLCKPFSNDLLIDFVNYLTAT